MPDSSFGVLGVKGLAVSPPNILLLIVVKQLSVCFLLSQSFPPEGFFGILSAHVDVMCTHLTVNTDSRHPAFWWFCLTLDILTSFFSAACDILCVLMVAVTQLCYALYIYKQLFVQLILGPVTALKWFQVTFLTSVMTNQQCALSDQH